MAFQSALASLAGAGAGPSPMGAPPQAASLGIGPPPDTSGGMPSPTNVGAMPVGNPGVDKKGAIDNAVLALRDVTGHVPDMASAINALIDQLKAKATPPPGKPGPSISAPDQPAASGLDTAPTMETGSPGA